MSTRVFALVIGIDNYKSGGIWNLHGCVDDAKRIKYWLANSLNVPKDQICVLLDKQATKQKIEESFMQHLVSNPGIERGDAILIYFAGHGSSLRAPTNWYQKGPKAGASVQLLCPYDHDTRTSHGRISGISDRSFQAMMDDLSASKGDNVTVVLDCCFSPSQTGTDLRDRSTTRCTPTSKANHDDLFRDLWPGARGSLYLPKHGFFRPDTRSHTSLIACPSRGRAGEDKAGGKFTTAFLHAMEHLPLHCTSYSQLVNHLRREDGESQQYSCFGNNMNRVLFNSTPFATNRQLSRANLDQEKHRVQIDLGEIHGVVPGTELSLHYHNRQCSPNPPFEAAIVTEIYSSWCFAHLKSQSSEMPESCWAKVTRWNNHRPFRVYLKSSLVTFIRMWKLRTRIPAKPGHTSSPNGLNVVRVKHPNLADISLTMERDTTVVVQHNPPLLDQAQRVVRLHKKDGVQVIDDAALFNLHLLNKNPESPLQNLVWMELYQLDSLSWDKVGPNNLHNSTATIPYQAGAIFQVVIRNHSHKDLWPYLAYLDPSRYRVTMLYHPDVSSQEPPLPSHGQLEIGSGMPGSEALCFTLSDDNDHDYGYLKLFLSSIPVDMHVLGEVGEYNISELDYKWATFSKPALPVWDTLLASLVFVRRPDE